MVKKLVQVAPEQELIAQRPLKIKQAPEVFWQGSFPASLIYAIYGLRPHRPLSRRLLCRFPPVILQQTAQSFSTPHCSHEASRRAQSILDSPVIYNFVKARL